MKTTRRNLLTVTAPLAISLLAFLPAAADTPTPEESADGYATGQSARVRYDEGGTRIQRAALSDPDPGGANTPVFVGDAIVTDEDGRAEVELASGTLLRLDGATDLRFLGMPDPYGSATDTVLQLATGRLRIDARVDDAEEFRVDTPAGSIYLSGNADVRIDVAADGRTEVVARRGRADVVADRGSVAVRAGYATVFDPGGAPVPPEPFNTFSVDAFDRWVARRDELDRNDGSGEVYASLPEEVRPYHRELARNGDWYWETDYGWVWTPAVVPVGWRPYYAGYWHHGPAGYFWVSAEPWGWAPYHYGRWVWVVGRGWAWVPGRLFGGAWVAWSWGPSYVGWAPLDFWDRPLYLGTLYYGYYDPRCWTFVSYNHFVPRPRVRVYTETYTVIDVGRRELEDAVVVRRPPRHSPVALAASTETRDEALQQVRQDPAARVLPPLRVSETGTAFRADDDARAGRMARGPATGKRAEPAPSGRMVPATGAWPGATTLQPGTTESVDPQQRLLNRDQFWKRLGEMPRTRKQPVVEQRRREDEGERQARPQPPAKPQEKPKSRELSWLRPAAPAAPSAAAEPRERQAPPARSAPARTRQKAPTRKR